MARQRGRPEAVDRDSLIAATLQLIDSVGIEGVTMRRLAETLGVSAMAAYRHVGSKEELLRIAAAAVVGEIRVPPGGVPWQQLVQAFFESFHDRLLDHPGVAALFGGQTFLSETVYAVSDPIFAAILDAGFEPADAVSLFMGCASCSIGAAILESAAAQRPADLADDREAILAAENYPAIAAVAELLPGRQSAASHRTALRNLIAGFEAELLP